MPKGNLLDREEEFKADWTSEMLVRDIAKKYDISSQTALRRARDFGLDGRYKQRSGGSRFALTGGAWQPDDRGIMRWIPKE